MRSEFSPRDPREPLPSATDLSPPPLLAVSGKTPLILAGEAGLLSVAAALLAAGCDESRCDAEGYNAAFWAAAGGHRGFALLGGAPEPRKPTMEEMALHMGQTRMALVAVGAKLKAVPRAKKKAKGAKARR